jgi:hypothetical protein
VTAPLIIHGVVRAAAPTPAEAPAHERFGFAAPCGALAALVSPLALDAEGAADAAEALRHHAILAAYAGRTDVAPARFGAAVAGRDAAAALLAESAERHAAALDRIAGCVEFGVRVLAPEAPAAEPTSPTHDGAGYLRARLDARRRRARAAEDRAAALDAAAGRIGAAARETLAVPISRAAHGPRRLIDLAALVPRDGGEAFGRAVDAARALCAAEGLRLETTGPWPAYSFMAPARGEEAA